MHSLLHASSVDTETDFTNKTNKTKVTMYLNLPPEKKRTEEAALVRNWSYCLMHDWKALYYAGAEDGMKTYL